MEIKEKVIIGRPQSRPSMRETTLCPICKNAVSKYDNYCRRCGIRLDWSDYTEKFNTLKRCN